MTQMVARAVSAVFAASIAAASSAAFGYGAIAIGEPDDVAKDGLAMGWSADIETQEKASEEALYWCGNVTEPPVKAETRALCKIVYTFRHECIAVAVDSKPHTPGWGWASGATKEAALADAMAHCQAKAGPERAQYCAAQINACDTSP